MWNCEMSFVGTKREKATATFNDLKIHRMPMCNDSDNDTPKTLRVIRFDERQSTVEYIDFI